MRTTQITEENQNYLSHHKGLKSWLFTLDHKRIGLMFLGAILSFFLLGGLLALGVRLELFAPGKQLMDADTYNKFFTMHGMIMVFLFIVPSTPSALGNFVLPMMVGAKDVAFPRLNLLSFYIYMAGAILALSTLIFGGLDTGWTFYTPYSSQIAGPVIIMGLAVFIMGFSSMR